MVGNFCQQCGAPLNPNARFCGQCAAPSAVDQSSPVAGAPAAAPSGGWQVVVGDELPKFAPVDSVEEEAPSPAEAPSSLRGSAWYVLFTTANDLLCAWSTGDPAATRTAGIRAGAAGFTFLFGILAGTSRGFLAKLVSLSSIFLVLAQGESLIEIAKNAAADPRILGPILELLPRLAGGEAGGTLLANLQMLKGAWMNILTQGIALLAAFSLFRRSREK